MEREIRVDGVDQKVGLTAEPGRPGEYSFQDRLTGESRRIRVERSEADRLIVSVDDRVYAVEPLRRVSERFEFLMNSQRVVAERPSRKAASPGGSAVASVDELVVAHFPAKVVRVPVGAGDRVEKGSTLFVLEAMKMETNLEAPRDCTVLELFVTEGEMVARGTKLARLDFH